MIRFPAATFPAFAGLWRRRGDRNRFGIGLALALAAGFALVGLVLAPRAIDAAIYLSVQDDPAGLADRALDGKLDADAVKREIESALAANDADLAQSFLELARDRGVPVASDLAKKVETANAASAQAASAAERFARGLIIGEPDDLVGLAGAAMGDLFVFGDIRDAVREGAKLAAGEPADQLILGLSCVGLAVTAGTYAMLGAGTPARVGVSLVKAARKTGRLSRQMGDSIGRSLREIVDWSEMRRALAGASLTEPAMAVRAARQAVKLDKADGLVRLASDIGQVQSKAGTRAALDGLKLAESPREMSRIARLAGAKGGKTRAILKTLGRGAFSLTLAVFDLAMWLFSALLTLIGFVASTKRAVERATLRRLRLRKAKKADTRRLAIAQARA